MKTRILHLLQMMASEVHEDDDFSFGFDNEDEKDDAKSDDMML